MRIATLYAKDVQILLQSKNMKREFISMLEGKLAKRRKEINLAKLLLKSFQ